MVVNIKNDTRGDIGSSPVRCTILHSWSCGSQVKETLTKIPTGVANEKPFVLSLGYGNMSVKIEV